MIARSVLGSIVVPRPGTDLSILQSDCEQIKIAVQGIGHDCDPSIAIRIGDGVFFRPSCYNIERKG